MEIDPNATIKTNDPGILMQLMREIIKKELYSWEHDFYTDKQIDDAIQTAIEYHKNRKP